MISLARKLLKQVRCCEQLKTRPVDPVNRSQWIEIPHFISVLGEHWSRLFFLYTIAGSLIPDCQCRGDQRSDRLEELYAND
jgi:hypothetical protein